MKLTSKIINSSRALEKNLVRSKTETGRLSFLLGKLYSTQSRKQGATITSVCLSAISSKAITSMSSINLGLYVKTYDLAKEEGVSLGGNYFGICRNICSSVYTEAGNRLALKKMLAMEEPAVIIQLLKSKRIDNPTTAKTNKDVFSLTEKRMIFAITALSRINKKTSTLTIEVGNKEVYQITAKNGKVVDTVEV